MCALSSSTTVWRLKSLKEFHSIEKKDFQVTLETTVQARLVGRIK